MTEEIDPRPDRVAEAVRRALSLVGPAEHAYERLVEEAPQEDAVSR